MENKIKYEINGIIYDVYSNFENDGRTVVDVIIEYIVNKLLEEEGNYEK